jgi:HD-like signal output (HDOD) protein
VTHLLLAADDEQALRATESALWRQRGALEITCTDSREEARTLLECGDVDIIACDTALSGDHGFSLLEQAMRQSPSTIRIGICTAADPSALMTAVSLAHRCIYRPWRPQDFGRMIGRLVELRATVGLDVCHEVATGGDGVPLVPRVYSQLVAQLSRHEIDLDRVTATIARDIGLTASLLRMVNSVLFGLKREITSVREAILYLGLNTVRDIVLSDEAHRLVETLGDAEPGRARALRRRATRIAIIAKKLAHKTGARDAAFLAGLMHVLGPFVGTREHMDPVTSASLGGYVLGLWGIPELVVHAVAAHITPDRSDLENPALAAIFLALDLSDIDVGGPPRSEQQCQAARATLGLAPIDISRVTQELAAPRST